MQRVPYSGLLFFVFTVALGAMALIEPADAEVTTQTRTTTYSYDVDGNGIIEPDEFRTYVYRRADSDMDGFLVDEEWDTNFVQYSTPDNNVDFETYSYWDKDNDNRLDRNEIDTLISDTELYTSWDNNRNGLIESDEFAAGTFMTYDTDNDGQLSQSEWQNAIM